MSSLPRRPLRRLLALLSGAVLAALPLTVLTAAPAHAETPNVVASCASLTVKPNGYAARGEVRVVIDGQVQTDGDEEGWTGFKGSFPGVYTFEPDVTHTYRVEINSFAQDSRGRAFSPGDGGDATFSGPTTACSPVGIAAAASNCVAVKTAGKQAIDVELTRLRRSVTYLAEVRDAGGDLVQHFQFRTAPVVEHRFSGLRAEDSYRIRVVDQSNPVLSHETSVSIPGCAATPSLRVRVSTCDARARTATIDAVLGELAVGRHYRVALRGDGYEAERSASGVHSADSASFAGVPAGARYSLSVSDVAAPVTVTRSVVVASCAGGSSAGSHSAGHGSPPTRAAGRGSAGAAAAGPGSVPTASAVPAPAAGAGAGAGATSGSRPTPPRASTPVGAPTPSSDPPVRGTGPVPAPVAVPSAPGAVPSAPSARGDAAAPDAESAPRASRTGPATAVAGDPGPGDALVETARGGTAADDHGLVAASEPAHARSAPVGLLLAVPVAGVLALVLAAARRRRRTP